MFVFRKKNSYRTIEQIDPEILSAMHGVFKQLLPYGLSLAEFNGLALSVFIERNLIKNKFNRSKTARELGMHRATLLKYCKGLGVLTDKQLKLLLQYSLPDFNEKKRLEILSKSYEGKIVPEKILEEEFNSSEYGWLTQLK